MFFQLCVNSLCLKSQLHKGIGFVMTCSSITRVCPHTFGHVNSAVFKAVHFKRWRVSSFRLWISPSAVWQTLTVPSPSRASLEAENLFGLYSSSVNWQRERGTAWHRRADHAWRSHCSYCQGKNNWTKSSCKFLEATEFEVGSVHSCRWQVELPVSPDSLWIIWRRKKRRKTGHRNRKVTGIKEPHVRLKENNKQTALEELQLLDKHVEPNPCSANKNQTCPNVCGGLTGRTEADGAVEEKMKELLN